MKFEKFLLIAIAGVMLGGCFEGKSKLACDDSHIQNSVKKMIKPHLGDVFGANLYKDEVSENKAVRDMLKNLSAGFSLKNVLQTSHMKQNFDVQKECKKEDLLCKIVKASDKFNEFAKEEMIGLSNFKSSHQDEQKSKLSCTADISINDAQSILSESNATKFDQISTLDYELSLSEDKKQVRIEIKRL